MQLKHIVLAVALVWPLAAGAQTAPDPASSDLNQQWLALNIALGNVQKSLSVYVTKTSEAADAEARLRWVLDNWVPKAATEK